MASTVLSRSTIAALLLAVLLPGCGQRGAFVLDATAGEVGSVHEILVATSRGPALDTRTNARVRAEELSFARLDISVPPDRRPGTVTPPSGSSPDPSRKFLVVSAEALDGEAGFAAAVNAAVADRPAPDREAIVFVHGFNTNLAEGIYRHAQMRHDFRAPGIAVHYAWPSAGSVRAYAFDRESALFARDGLERLLDRLTRSDVSRIIVVGHSMGAQVVMETLRQMAIRGAPSFFRKLEAVVLVSPDLDVEVFRAQLRPIGQPSPPVYVFVSGRDRALRVSSMLRGQRSRLGSIEDASAVADLPITIIDVSAVEGTEDRLGHFTLATSPSLIALIGGMSEVGIQTFEGEAQTPSLFETTISIFYDATMVVLQPLAR